MIANLQYCLTRIWQERGTPDWWSDRWLVVIFKKEHDIVKIGDLRPLILMDTVEAMVRGSTTTDACLLEKHDVLRHSHHGFCAGRSTIKASLLFINKLEEALVKGKVLHTRSWDITRAFNSVSKNVMRMAWARLEFHKNGRTG